MATELTQEEILYEIYQKVWYNEHSKNDGEPVCFDEFVSNEMTESDIISYYIDKFKDMVLQNYSN